MSQNSRASSTLSALLQGADAFLLDYNGTLSKDEDVCAEIMSAVAWEKLGACLSFERYFKEFAGDTEESVFERLGNEVGGSFESTPFDLMQEFNRRYLIKFKQHSTISPQVRQFLHAARGLGKHLIVVTAASRDVIEPVLEISGLVNTVDGVVSLETVPESKPNPECYLRALDCLGIGPELAVAFEDSRAGLTAARAARLDAIGVLGSLHEAEMSSFTPYMVSELHPHLLA